MALDNNTVVNYTDKTTIKNWFKTGLKPTQKQFWSTWDSFWHKSESLPISSISGLGNLLDGKAEENHEHNQYAKNDATSLTADNITAWQQKLGVADLKFDDKAITTTQDYADFGLQAGATINAFNNAIYQSVGNKLDAPTEEGTTTDYPYVVGVNREGDTAFLPVNSFGKVDKVMGVEPDADKNVDLSGLVLLPPEGNEEESEFTKLGLFKPSEGKVIYVSKDTYTLNDASNISTSNINKWKEKLGVGDLDYIPLSGTAEGKPITGTLKVDESIDTLLQVGEYEIEPSPENPIGRGSVGKLSINKKYYGYQSTSLTGAESYILGFVVGVNPLSGEPIVSSSYFDLAANKIIGYEFTIYQGIRSLLLQADVINVDKDYSDFATGVKTFLAQRSYVDAMQTKPTNWTNPSQRFSGLVDKSSDATYNKVMVLDDNGNAGMKNLNSDTLIDILTNATEDQINIIREILYPQI